MNNISRKISKFAVCVLGSTMVISTIAFAKSYIGKKVNGSTYSVVASGAFDNSGNYMTVTLTKILKSDGTKSNYSKVRADVIDSKGNQISESTNVPLILQEGSSIMLKQSYSSGTNMKLRMKGNDNKLDCIVDFSAPLG